MDHNQNSADIHNQFHDVLIVTQRLGPYGDEEPARIETVALPPKTETKPQPQG